MEVRVAPRTNQRIKTPQARLRNGNPGMRTSEAKRAVVAGLLCPLSLAISVPAVTEAYLVLARPPQVWLDWGFIGMGALVSVLFGYVGFAIFGVPLYFVLRLLCRWPIVALVVAGAAGMFAALVTPPILLSTNWAYVLWDLRTLAENPRYWIDPTSLAGALTGILFWFFVRPGRNPRSNRTPP